MHKITFLCCFSFFLFLDCFLDLLRESKKNTMNQFMNIGAVVVIKIDLHVDLKSTLYEN